MEVESPQLQQALTAMEGRIESTVNNAMSRTVSGPVSDHNFTQVLSDMEDRLRTYVDTARVSQASVLHEQELERAAQKARSLNLRVVGLAETEGEDTRQAVLNLFQDILRVSSPGIAQAARISKGESGFEKISSIGTVKTRAKGRGSGGIAIWGRSGLRLEVQVEKVDIHKNFICLRISTSPGTAPTFLVVAYFPPWGSPVYTSDRTEDPFSEVSQMVLMLQKRGPVWILGDFNGRSESRQGILTPEAGSSMWHAEENSVWTRLSVDKRRNRFTEPFLHMASVCSLTILNGTEKFVHTNEYTFSSSAGESVVDYLMASVVVLFILMPRNP
ncbi:hypothetical protein R1sor_016646 [Riccia sorocarpa]